MSTESIIIIIGLILFVLGLILAKKNVDFLAITFVGSVITASAFIVMCCPQCPQCDKRQWQDNSYCIACGTEMAKETEPYCSVCEKEIKINADFCPDCGSQITKKDRIDNTEVVSE